MKSSLILSHGPAGPLDQTRTWTRKTTRTRPVHGPAGPDPRTYLVWVWPSAEFIVPPFWHQGTAYTPPYYTTVCPKIPWQELTRWWIILHFINSTDRHSKTVSTTVWLSWFKGRHYHFNERERERGGGLFHSSLILHLSYGLYRSTFGSLGVQHGPHEHVF